MGFIWLIPRSDTGNQEGIPRPAGRGSGLCPKNPQPFEKGWRKLQFAWGRAENLFAIFCETVYNRTQMVLFLR